MQSRFDMTVARKVAAIAVESGCRLVHSHSVRGALVARRVQGLLQLPWVHHVHSPALHELQDRLRQGAAVILAVGLFRPRKGLEHLVYAAALLRAAGHDFRMRFAGEFADASYEATIRNLVDQLRLGDKIECSGFVADVEGALRECDIFVLPSLCGEGMPAVAQGSRSEALRSALTFWTFTCHQPPRP